MTSSNGNIFRVTGPLCGEFTGPGEFLTQGPVTRRFDVFFDLRLNKRLSKQPSGWWFEPPSWSLWRQCNESKWPPMDSSFEMSNKMKLFNHHKGTLGTKFRRGLKQNDFIPWVAWLFGDACYGKTWIWMSWKSIVSVWCFGRLGLNGRYRAHGSPSPN